LLRTQRNTLERGARALLERETLDEADLAELFKEPAAAQ
jgi:ATP-dependent Zn protease